MKAAGIFLILISTIFQALAQETVAPSAKKLQQLYLGFGAGPTFTFASDLEKRSLTLFSHLNLSFRPSTFFRGGLYYSNFSDNLRKYPSLTYTGDLPPSHEVLSYYLAFGKRKQLSKYFLAQATAGISLNQLRQPENIRYKSNYGFAFVGNSDPFLYDEVIRNRLGVIVQAEIMSAHFLSVGSFFHYIPKASHAGLTLALNLGLITRN